MWQLVKNFRKFVFSGSAFSRERRVAGQSKPEAKVFFTGLLRYARNDGVPVKPAKQVKSVNPAKLANTGKPGNSGAI